MLPYHISDLVLASMFVHARMTVAELFGRGPRLQWLCGCEWCKRHGFIQDVDEQPSSAASDQ